MAPLAAEWRLYAPLVAHFRARGYRAAASVTDPRGRRMEVDVVAFDDALRDVRLVEAKARATGALVAQALSRLALAPLAYAAVPAAEAPRLEALASAGGAEALGLLAVAARSVDVVREATPQPERVQPARAAALARVLAGLLADRRA